MNIQASSKVVLASVLLGTCALASTAPKAIANEPEPEMMMWRAPITNEFTATRFTSDPYGNVQTITLSDENKTDIEFTTVQDEATADAPKSESYNSGFKIRIGLDNNNSNTTSEE